MRRQSRGNNALKLAGLSSALAVAMGGLGYATWQSIGKETADEFGCFASAHQTQTVVLFDASEPRFNEEQGRSLRTYFDRLYETLGFNEHLSFITSEADQVASIVSPRFHVCGQATRPAQLEEIGAASAQAGYLKKQKYRLYEKIIAPELDTLLSENPDDSRRQEYQSPIMEMIGDISRMPALKPGDRLIIISDMIQNSDSARFCRVQNEMPPFHIFKKRPVYARLKPNSLDGIDVEVLMVQRIGYGRDGYEYCSGEEELIAFWRNFFTDNGARAHFIRIRHGHVQG